MNKMNITDRDRDISEALRFQHVVDFDKKNNTPKRYYKVQEKIVKELTKKLNIKDIHEFEKTHGYGSEICNYILEKETKFLHFGLASATIFKRSDGWYIEMGFNDKRGPFKSKKLAIESIK